jgi:hypothetical protein
VLKALQAEVLVLREDDRESKDKQRMAWVTWLGVLGAAVVMAVALLASLRQTKPDTLLAPPTTLVFSGQALQSRPPDPIAVSLHNLIVLCSRSDFVSAVAYIDPESAFADRPEAVCGAVTGMLQPSAPADYRFENFAVVDNEASAYITIQAQPHAGERYIFNMRRVRGKWYFTVP